MHPAILRLVLTAAVPLAATPPAATTLATATTRAYHFPFLDGSALLSFRGTALAPGASGQARVRGEDGRLRLHAHVRGLPPATAQGPEFLTYVLWAVTPAGRAVNLGELRTVAGRAHLETSTALPTFGLLVSAEPHYAVTRISHAVMLEGQPSPASRALEAVDATYPLLLPGTYVPDPEPAPASKGPVSPYVFQARNAVRIARLEEADRLAPAAFQAAAEQLQGLEGESRLALPGAVARARRVALLAEDARLAAERARMDAHLAEERERATQAQARADAAQAQVDAARAQVDAARALASQEARRASRQERAASEAQLAVRRDLLTRLNTLLRTQETPEGLLATVTDVGFPSGRDRLTPAARENLAKVAGILLAHPGLKLKVRGHTDASGRPEFNERLSRRRADAVRRFLAEQGIPALNIEATGLGSRQPVAGNDSPMGRQANRRVDLLVGGEPIGL